MNDSSAPSDFTMDDDDEAGEDSPVRSFDGLLLLAEHSRRRLDGFQCGGEPGVHGHLQDNL